ncbi:hypothetical protein [Amycolatopsis nigrescens]|uniref:hypothetical protein n=1 Tax=Amycolatopsis nigrescens TaxID=381445 RepID=UPI0003764F5C|nr:hypothetical protein [Amycolatopsis nigrescens]
MSEFAAVLRGRIEDTQGVLATARSAGHDYEVHLHVSRLQDLLELAARSDIDTDGWVDSAMLASALDQD